MKISDSWSFALKIAHWQSSSDRLKRLQRKSYITIARLFHDSRCLRLSRWYRRQRSLLHTEAIRLNSVQGTVIKARRNGVVPSTRKSSFTDRRRWSTGGLFLSGSSLQSDTTVNPFSRCSANWTSLVRCPVRNFSSPAPLQERVTAELAAIPIVINCRRERDDRTE